MKTLSVIVNTGDAPRCINIPAEEDYGAQVRRICAEGIWVDDTIFIRYFPPHSIMDITVDR